MLAKGLEQQHTSHHKMDHSRLAGKQPGSDRVGGALDRLLTQGNDTSNTVGLTTTTMTTSTMETTSDMDTPGVSGKRNIRPRGRH